MIVFSALSWTRACIELCLVGSLAGAVEEKGIVFLLYRFSRVGVGFRDCGVFFVFVFVVFCHSGPGSHGVPFVLAWA